MNDRLGLALDPAQPPPHEIAAPDYEPDPSPIQVAAIISTSPGITCAAKRRPPATLANTTLLMVLVVSPARIGTTASRGAILFAATSDATETAAE